MATEEDLTMKDVSTEPATIGKRDDAITINKVPDESDKDIESCHDELAVEDEGNLSRQNVGEGSNSKETATEEALTMKDISTEPATSGKRDDVIAINKVPDESDKEIECCQSEPVVEDEGHLSKQNVGERINFKETATEEDLTMKDISTEPATSGKRDDEIAINKVPDESDKEIESCHGEPVIEDEGHLSRQNVGEGSNSKETATEEGLTMKAVSTEPATSGKSDDEIAINRVPDESDKEIKSCHGEPVIEDEGHLSRQNVGEGSNSKKTATEEVLTMKDISTEPATSGKRDDEIAINKVLDESDKEIECCHGEPVVEDEGHLSRQNVGEGSNSKETATEEGLTMKAVSTEPATSGKSDDEIAINRVPDESDKEIKSCHGEPVIEDEGHLSRQNVGEGSNSKETATEEVLTMKDVSTEPATSGKSDDEIAINKVPDESDKEIESCHGEPVIEDEGHLSRQNVGEGSNSKETATEEVLTMKDVSTEPATSGKSDDEIAINKVPDESDKEIESCHGEPVIEDEGHLSRQNVGEGSNSKETATEEVLTMKDVSTEPATSGKSDDEIAINKVPDESDKEIESCHGEPVIEDEGHLSRQNVGEGSNSKETATEEVLTMKDVSTEPATSGKSDDEIAINKVPDESDKEIESCHGEPVVEDEGHLSRQNVGEGSNSKETATEEDLTMTEVFTEPATTNTTLPATLIDGQQDTSKNDDFVLEAKESPITRSGHTKKSDENEGTQTHIIIHYICIYVVMTILFCLSN